MIENNNQPTVEIKETKKRPGVWESVGYVNGKPICSCCSKDRAYNLKCVIEDLADAGHAYTKPEKRLAPKKLRLEGKMKDITGFLKNANIPSSQIIHGSSVAPTDAFLSETGQTDLRTEYAA